MPDEKDGQSAAGQPNANPLVQSPSNMSGQKNIPTDPSEGGRSQTVTAKLEEDFKVGERWLIGIGIATLLMNGLIACIYWGQLKEMRKATQATQIAALAARDSANLERTQITASQGAEVIFAPILGDRELKLNVVGVPSRAPAKQVHATLTVQRVYLPSLKAVGPPSSDCQMDWPLLVGNDVMSCHIPTLTQAVHAEMMHGRQSVFIKGSVTYDNGFGDIVSQPICKGFYGYQLTEFRSDGTNRMMGAEDFIDCVRFDGMMRQVRDLRKGRTDTYKPPATVISPPTTK